MSAALTVEGKQVDTKPPERQVAGAHEDRVALNGDSPFVLLAAAVVHQARMDQAHRWSSDCKEWVQCPRAAILARRFLTALRTSDPSWGAVWLDWLQYAAVRAGLIPRRRSGYGLYVRASRPPSASAAATWTTS